MNFIEYTMLFVVIAVCVCMQQAWSQFASRLEDFSQPQHLSSALACLNLLVTDALRHVPDVIAYLSRLHNQSVFNFCAIPQVDLLYLPHSRSNAAFILLKHPFIFSNCSILISGCSGSQHCQAQSWTIDASPSQYTIHIRQWSPTRFLDIYFLQVSSTTKI